MTILSAGLTFILAIGWAILLAVFVVVPFVIVPVGLLYASTMAMSSVLTTTAREVKAYKELSAHYGAFMSQNEINSLFSRASMTAIAV